MLSRLNTTKFATDLEQDPKKEKVESGKESLKNKTKQPHKQPKNHKICFLKFLNNVKTTQNKKKKTKKKTVV